MRRGVGGRKRVWSDEQALEALKLEAARLGRTPASLEAGAIGSLCPTSTVYRQRFGSWSEALKLVGLAPRKRGDVLRRPKRTEILYALRRAQEITAEKRRYWMSA